MPKSSQSWGWTGKSRNADSMSVLDKKQSEPNLWITEIALSIVIYWREKSSLSLKWVILEFPDLGKDRWNIFRNLSERLNLETRPIGKTWKFSNGGCREETWSTPFSYSGPKKSILAPSISFKHILLTNSLLGGLWRARCRLKTFTWVSTPPKSFAAVTGAMVLTVGVPYLWGWLLIGFGGDEAPDPAVLPSTTWLVALVCTGAGDPGTWETLVEVIASM